MIAGQEIDVWLPTLHPAQLRILQEARRFNVLMCGRRFGKTTLGEELGINPVLDGLSIGWFAPTYKLLKEAWRDIKTTLIDVPGMEKSEQDYRIVLPNGGAIECWTFEAGDDIARGRKYHRALVDEAGLLRELMRVWYAAIRPTLADYQGDAWFFGTPKGVGDFSTMYDWGQDITQADWASWRFSTLDNPFILPSEVEAMRREMPDAIYRQEVLGEPIDDAEHPIGLQAINACLAPLSDAEPVIWGLDLARSVDYTVAIGLDKDGHVCRLERFQAPWGVARGRLSTLIGKIWCRADSTGVGDPVVEQLQRDGCMVEAIVLTARNKQQAVESLITAIQQKQITYPEGPIKAELCTLTAERTAYGIRYEALEGRHDDCVIALAFAVEGWVQLGYSKRKVVVQKVYSQDRTLIDRTTGREPKGEIITAPQPVINKHPWKAPRKTKESWTESL